MALGQALPFGLRDVKIKPIAADGTVGAAIDLPAAQTFEFKEAEDFEDLRGDDVIVTTHGKGPIVTWSLEAGGISLEAYAAIAGGTVTATGVTPNQKKSYSKLGTDARPAFQVEGQVISDSGGDVHGVVYRCKAKGDIGGTFSDESFFITACSGEGYARASDSKLYDLVQNETASAIT